jgi:dipeptidyl aminopeptidase/acylaminoacyl peptidase
MKALILAAALCALGTSATAADTPAAKPVLEDYGKLPAVEGISLSPGGDWLAFITVDHDQRKVVIKKLGGPGGVALSLGHLKAREVGWLPGNHVLVQMSATVDLNPDDENIARSEAVESFVVDAASGQNFTVFDAQRAKILPTTYGYYGRSTSGGKSFAYFGGLTLEGSGSSFVDFSADSGTVSHGHTDLYRVDLKSGVPEVAAGGSELHGSDWLVDPDGGVAAHAEYNRSGVWRLYRGLTDNALVAQATSPIGDVNLVGLGRAPATALVWQPYGDGGEFAYVEYDLKGGSPHRLFGDEGVADLIRSPLDDTLIGAVTNGDDPKTLLLDPALQAKFDKAIRALPGEIVNLVSATSDLDHMVLLAQGTGDSGTYYLVDYPQRKLEAVAWRYPTILQAAVGEVRVVPYKASDGLQMQGILTLPSGCEAKNLPLVVLPHGGPQARDYKRFDWWAQAFASRGYAVFQPNFRGSAGFGKAFRDAGFGQWGRKMQTDISDGVAELAREGIVDPKRACIVGASYGGYAALAGVTVQQGFYRCAVSVGGISDLNMMLTYAVSRAGEDSATIRYWRRFLGVSGDSSPALDALSPRKLARRADAPILLIYGRDDSVVSINQSRDFADALKGAGKPYEMVQLDGEDHWLSREATRIRMLEASVAFVEKNNPPS